MQHRVLNLIESSSIIGRSRTFCESMRKMASWGGGGIWGYINYMLIRKQISFEGGFSTIIFLKAKFFINNRSNSASN